MYGTYLLDQRLKIVPGPETKTVNFNWLKNLLLSKDLWRNDELSWAKNNLRFFDSTVDLVGNRVCFASFTRSGNTMTRKYIEAITGIYTGSDTNLIHSVHLQTMGLAGEEHVSDDNSVWVTKTHYP